MSGGLTDDRNDAVDRHRLAFLGSDLCNHSGYGRGDLRVHFVGGNLKERLVTLDRLANLLDPSDDGSLGDRFPHLGHENVGRHVSLPRIDLELAKILRMNGRAVRGMGGLAHGLGKCRMGVDRPNQLLNGRLEPESHRRLGDQLRGTAPDHVDAQ